MKWLSDEYRAYIVRRNGIAAGLEGSSRRISHVSGAIHRTRSKCITSIIGI